MLQIPSNMKYRLADVCKTDPDEITIFHSLRKVEIIPPPPPFFFLNIISHKIYMYLLLTLLQINGSKNIKF